MQQTSRPHRRPAMNSALPLCSGQFIRAPLMRSVSLQHIPAGAALNKRRHLLFHPAAALVRPCGFSLDAPSHDALRLRSTRPFFRTRLNQGDGQMAARSLRRRVIRRIALLIARRTRPALSVFTRPGRTDIGPAALLGFSPFAASPACGSCGISARSAHLPFSNRPHRCFSRRTRR